MKRRTLHLTALALSLAFSVSLATARADVLSAEDKTHFRAALEAAVN